MNTRFWLRNWQYDTFVERTFIAQTLPKSHIFITRYFHDLEQGGWNISLYTKNTHFRYRQYELYIDL